MRARESTSAENAQLPIMPSPSDGGQQRFAAPPAPSAAPADASARMVWLMAILPQIPDAR
jgi:hypothetical protein